jgi:hypothetical protein
MVLFFGFGIGYGFGYGFGFSLCFGFVLVFGSEWGFWLWVWLWFWNWGWIWLIDCSHFQAGKGRTGLMICCFLMFQYGISFQDSMDYYGRRRTHNAKVRY